MITQEVAMNAEHYDKEARKNTLTLMALGATFLVILVTGVLEYLV